MPQDRRRHDVPVVHGDARRDAFDARARSPALEALSGNGLLDGFADPALKEALELCLSCKACKTECPASIDMAAYKAEFFANYYQRHRRPLDARFFGGSMKSRASRALAPRLANLLSHAPGLRRDRAAHSRMSIRTASCRALPRERFVHGLQRHRGAGDSTAARGRAVSRHLQQFFSSPRSRSPQPKCSSARASGS